PRDLTLRDAREPHGLGQIVNRARGYTVYVRLLNDGDQCLVGRPASLKKGWEVAASPKLRNGNGQRAKCRVPRPLAITVALVRSVGGSFSVLRSTLSDRRPSLKNHALQPAGRFSRVISQPRHRASFQNRISVQTL